jgi:hypothetical protein
MLWEDNIKRDIQEIKWGGGVVNMIDLALNRIKWRIIAWNFLNICGPLNFHKDSAVWSWLYR